MRECEGPILDVLEKADLDFGGPPKRLGNECDALAVDVDGRLLAVEVKPLGGDNRVGRRPGRDVTRGSCKVGGFRRESKLSTSSTDCSISA